MQRDDKLSTSLQPQIVCPDCGIVNDTKKLPKGMSAHCHGCDTELYQEKHQHIDNNWIIALTCLFLFIPTLFLPFVDIRLLNVNFSADLVNGALLLMTERYPFLSLFIFFCSVATPILVCSSVLIAHWALSQKQFHAFKYSVLIAQRLKHWLMVDVYLISIAIAFFKLQEYAHINIRMGLICLILFQVVVLALLPKLNSGHYWDRWFKASDFNFEHVDVYCEKCHLSQPNGDNCTRCQSAMPYRKPLSLQKTWAYLSTATIALIPANLLVISVVFTNGERFEDTIFSGVVSLMKAGSYQIGAIIFIASIVVPIAKIIGLVYILLCIHFKDATERSHSTKLFKIIKAIGKWSILDLFVISIMVSLIDRDQILDFSPGNGAVAFAFVVVLTMLATEALDPRLIWDDSSQHSSTKAISLKTPPSTNKPFSSKAQQNGTNAHGI